MVDTVGNLDELIRDEPRLRAVAQSGIFDAVKDEQFDRITRYARRSLNVPVALISIIGADRQVFKSRDGSSAYTGNRHETPLSHSICKYVIQRRDPLAIGDAAIDLRTIDSPALQESGVMAYLGAPVFYHDQPIGALCVFDFEPRLWKPEDVTLMRELAHLVSLQLESAVRRRSGP